MSLFLISDNSPWTPPFVTTDGPDGPTEMPLPAGAETAWTDEQLASVGLKRLTTAADLTAHAADKRYAIETGGVVINGARIDTSRDSQAMITGAVAYLNNNPNATSVNFKALTGWVTLDKATMLAIGIAVGGHVQTCFSAEMAIDADITAGTITTTAAIDADTRWPAGA